MRRYDAPDRGKYQMMRSKLLLILALATAALLVLPTVAGADRKPTRHEARALFAALTATNHTCTRYAPGTCKLDYRISEVNSHWAAARVRATANGETTVRPETISMHRKGKGRAWAVNYAGDGGGCHMPKRPRNDLGLVCLVFGS